MVCYSQIREQLNIKPLDDTENKQAFLTHYLHSLNSNTIHYFSEPVSKYYPSIPKELLFNQQASIDFKWDVPFPAPENSTFSFIDLFAGIGGIRMGFQNVGGKCVFSSEWDKFSKVTYEINFGEVPFGDITKINEKFIPDHDVLLAGFPCQPFSIAGVSKKKSLGKQHGFLDKTQGTLFFDIARIIKEKRPKAFMLENVKNLLSHDKGKTFEIIYNTLDELEYSIHFQILDGKHFVPQHRERIIIVGFDRKVYHGDEGFKFPTMSEKDHKIKNLLTDNPDDKYTLSDKLWTYLQAYAAKHKAKGNGFGYGLTDLNKISRTLSARYYKDGAEILIPQENKNPRRLTPRECARLQGFPENFIIPVSDNQAYRQFGNSVVVPLIHSVANNIKYSLNSING